MDLLKAVERSGFVEVLTYWTIGLYESRDMTVANNLGLKNVLVSKYIITDDNLEEKEIFVVEIETQYGLTNWNKGEEKVLNTLVMEPTYECNDENEIVAAFVLEEEAFQYAKQNYPEVDLEKQIKMRYKYRGC